MAHMATAHRGQFALPFNTKSFSEMILTIRKENPSRMRNVVLEILYMDYWQALKAGADDRLQEAGLRK